LSSNGDGIIELLARPGGEKGTEARWWEERLVFDAKGGDYRLGERSKEFVS